MSKEPLESDFEEATSLYKAGRGMPGYDFHDIEVFSHPSGQYLSKGRFKHIDSDDGPSISVSWHSKEDGEALIEKYKKDPEYSSDWDDPTVYRDPVTGQSVAEMPMDWGAALVGCFLALAVMGGIGAFVANIMSKIEVPK